MADEDDLAELMTKIWCGNTSHSLLPDGTRNWRVFLGEILDGGFAYDIERIGSSESFISNQLGAQKDQEKSKEKLAEAFSSLIDETPFTAEDGLQRPGYYCEILSWVSGKYLNGNMMAAKKSEDFLCDLVQIPEQHDETLKKLQKKTASTLLCLMKQDKYKQNREAVPPAPTLSSRIDDVWCSWLNHDDPELRSIGCMGLIYFNHWHEQPDNVRHKFIVDITADKEKAAKLFCPAINDLVMFRVSDETDYPQFINDCHDFKKDYYDILIKRAENWQQIAEQQKIKIDNFKLE